MDTDTSRPGYTLAPIQFSRLTRRGILLGLSLPQLVALAIGVLTLVTALYSAGASGIAWTSPIWGTATLVAAIPIGGRKIVEWVPITSNWLWRAARGQLTYRRRIIRPRPAGTLPNHECTLCRDTPKRAATSTTVDPSAITARMASYRCSDTANSLNMRECQPSPEDTVKHQPEHRQRSTEHQTSSINRSHTDFKVGRTGLEPVTDGL